MAEQSEQQASAGQGGGLSRPSAGQHDHPAGAPDGAVSRHRAAAGDRADVVDRRRAGGGAQRADARRRSCRPIPLPTSRSPSRLHRVGTAAQVLRYVTAPDGTHHVICARRAAISRDRIPSGLSVPGRARRGDRRLRGDDARDRGARRGWCSSARREAMQLLPQRSPGSGGRHRQSGLGLRARRFRRRHHRRQARRKSRRCWRPSTSRSASTRCWRCWRSASRCSSSPSRSASRPSSRCRRSSASTSCASSFGTFRKSSAKATKSRSRSPSCAKPIEKAGMPKEAEDQAKKELKRLERMPEAAAEYGMIRTYLDWLIELPWSKLDPDTIDIAEARRILDEDHYGLPKIKRRILEYLAVRKLNPEGKSPILCFVGPPGVGKTSLGQSIARGDRPQVRAAEPRRRARRGRDPGPSAHLYRRAAGQHHPVDPQGRNAQPGDDARRGGQARRRLPRRSRRRRCSRCSIPSRTRRSATTISASPSTSRR